MKNKKIWFSIRKNEQGYTVWQNSEEHDEEKKRGGLGSYGLYTSRSRKDCIAYCERNKIKISSNR